VGVGGWGLKKGITVLGFSKRAPLRDLKTLPGPEDAEELCRSNCRVTRMSEGALEVLARCPGNLSGSPGGRALGT